MAAPSFDDLMNLGKAEAIIRRPSLGIRVGDISEMLIAGAAAMADRLIGWFAERVGATFLDGASGDDLTQLAADHWAIQRRAATNSVGTVTFNRASADGTAQSFPIGTTVATARDSQGNDVQFVTTQAASWASSRSIQERTLPCNMTLPSVDSTVMRRASSSAVRRKASSILALTSAADTRGLTVMRLVTPFTPIK